MAQTVLKFNLETTNEKLSRKANIISKLEHFLQVKSYDERKRDTRLLLKPFSIFGYMSLRSYFNLKYKSNFNITKI